MACVSTVAFVLSCVLSGISSPPFVVATFSHKFLTLMRLIKAARECQQQQQHQWEESGERESHTQFALPLNQEGALSVIPLGPSHKQNGRRKKKKLQALIFLCFCVCVCFLSAGLNQIKLKRRTGEWRRQSRKLNCKLRGCRWRRRFCIPI